MQNLTKKILTMPDAALLLVMACLGALGFALVMQFGFGIAPCHLCLWQRAPFTAVAALTLIAVLRRPYARALLALCAVLLLANSGVAFFHTGVERHWWEFDSSCTGSALAHAQSVDDLRQALLGTPLVRCDEISWTILGLSMANLNIAFSALLAVFAGMAARKA